MSRKAISLTLIGLLLTVFTASEAMAKKKAYVEDEDAKAKVSSSDEGWDDEAEAKPAKKRRAAAEDEEEVAPRKKRRAQVEEDEEEPAPKKRSRRRVADDEEDAKPAKKGKMVGFGFDVYAGYTYFNLGKVNDDRKKAYDYYKSAGVKVDNEMYIHHGYNVGLDLNLNLFSNILSVGPRIQYHGLFPHTETIKTTYSSSWSESKSTYSGSLVPLMVGVAVANPGSVSAQLGLNLGYGWAGYTNEYSYKDSSGYSSSSTWNYNGSAPVAELRAALRFGRKFHFALQGGYRWAYISEMRLSEDHGSAKKGDLVKDSNGSAYPYDFGGFDAGIDIGMKF